MNLSEIRQNIDRVDTEIRKLFNERMTLAEQVVTVKSETEDKIFKPDREREIINRNSREVSSDLVQEYQAMVKRIMEVSRKYQYGRMLELCQCFPYSFETEAVTFEKISVLEENSDYKDLYPDASFVTAASFTEMVQMLKEHKIDAGFAVMQEIGAGVNESFHRMISEEHFFVNECIVTGGENPKKCVLFSEHPIVLPEHNRFKVMFICANTVGSLGTLLTMISDYKINLTEMHSSPFKDGDIWNYCFFLEMEGNPGEKEIQSLIFQLSEETEKFQLLGSYHCEGDF